MIRCTLFASDSLYSERLPNKIGAYYTPLNKILCNYARGYYIIMHTKTGNISAVVDYNYYYYLFFYYLRTVDSRSRAYQVDN